MINCDPNARIEMESIFLDSDGHREKLVQSRKLDPDDDFDDVTEKIKVMADEAEKVRAENPLWTHWETTVYYRSEDSYEN